MVGSLHTGRVSPNGYSQTKASLTDRLAQLAGNVHVAARGAIDKPKIPADSKLGSFMAENPDVEIKFEYF